MIGRIGFDNLRVRCIIGDFPEERTHEQDLFIDLYVEADISKCIISDSIEDTIDYVKLGEICSSISKNQYQMLESYAYHVLKEITTTLPVIAAHIKVRKPGAFQQDCLATVELTLSKVL